MEKTLQILEVHVFCSSKKCISFTLDTYIFVKSVFSIATYHQQLIERTSGGGKAMNHEDLAKISGTKNSNKRFLVL